MVGTQCEEQKRGIQQNETKNTADKLPLLTNWSLMVKLYKLSWQFHILPIYPYKFPRRVMWWFRTAEYWNGTLIIKVTMIRILSSQMEKECRTTKSFFHLFGFFFPQQLKIKQCSVLSMFDTLPTDSINEYYCDTLLCVCITQKQYITLR